MKKGMCFTLGKRAFNQKFISVIFIFFFVLLGILGYFVIHTKNQVKDVFKMNKILQQENYYTAEFEFKMIALGRRLDRWYEESPLSLNKFHEQLKKRENLIKVPQFQSKEEELEFYLNLQNPKTGAFMDDAYPMYSYTGPTGNILSHLDILATDLQKPLKLKYPLKYLDEVNTPEKMRAYLTDISTIGWIGSLMPQTTFHHVRDMMSLFLEDSVVHKHNLYTMPPETLEAMIKWLYDWQDPETGLWGPKDKKGKLMIKDVSNSTSMMKILIDENGQNIYPQYPLRYKNKMLKSFIDYIDFDIPPDSELHLWHEWLLVTSKNIRTIMRYFSNDIDTEEDKIKNFINFYLDTIFEKFYVREEGGFTNEPYGKHSLLDGKGAYFIFKDIGAFTPEKQRKLWGEPMKTIKVRKKIEVKNDLTPYHLDFLDSCENVNSFRIFFNEINFNHLFEGVKGIFYNQKKSIPDIMELNSKYENWVKSTSQSVGNWVSKDDIMKELSSLSIPKTPIYAYDDVYGVMLEVWLQNKKVNIIGFDKMQIPVCEIIYF